MASAKNEITAIAIEHGYTGAAPKTIAGAIDALADTLAGEDVKGSRSISGAVKALAPYIGSGGTKRVELFNETVTTEDEGGMNRGLVLGNGTTADEVYVTFDGTEYELPRIQFPGGVDYGYGAFGETGPDFSTYPLMLSYSKEAEGWVVFTETAGTYTIAAYTVSSDGGGGGTELGPLVNWPRSFGVVPTVEETTLALTGGLLLSSVVIDSSSVLVNCLPNFDGTQEAPKVSSGLTLRTIVYGQSLEGVYVATATTIENDVTITAVRESDVVPRDVTTMTIDGYQYVSFTFDMPELGENEYLVFVIPQ